MGNKARRLLRVNPNGFTLIEIMVTLLISGLVMSAIYGVFISSGQSYRTQESVADVQQRARVGLDFMVRDMRMAGLDPMGTANAGIVVATATNIQFTADRDMNGAIDTNNMERLTYTWDGTGTLSLIRYEGTTSQITQPLIDGVSDMAFTYWDVNGAQLAAPLSAADLANVRSVIISIRCEGVDVRGHALDRTLSTRINCRNLGI